MSALVETGANPLRGEAELRVDGAALVLRRTVAKGKSSGFLMEMPKYQWPRITDLALGLWQRAVIFLKRAGTIIFTSTIILWVLLSFPKPPEGSTESPVSYSAAGRIASCIGCHVEAGPGRLFGLPARGEH